MSEPVYLSMHLLNHEATLLDRLLDQEAILQRAAKEKITVLHFWQHPRGILCGTRERTLPNFSQAVQAMIARGYEVIVRPFGGLSVPCDEGIINITYMTPEPITIEQGFAFLAERLIETCQAYGSLQVGEVIDSYCPGRYDVTLNGLKVAGIAQRKILQATAVSAYFNLYGNCRLRETLIRDFYQQALSTEPYPPWVPTVSAGHATSLFPCKENDESQWLDFFTRFLATFERLGYDFDLLPPLTPKERQDSQARMAHRMCANCEG